MSFCSALSYVGTAPGTSISVELPSAEKDLSRVGRRLEAALAATAAVVLFTWRNLSGSKPSITVWNAEQRSPVDAINLFLFPTG